MSSRTKADPATTAKLLVVPLAFAWGLNWIAAAIALRELSPWSLRVTGSGIGAATLFAAAVLSGHNLKVPRGEYIHIMIAGLFNVAAFQILSSFAQLSGATTRAIIITYSMPIWTTVLSCLVLGERLNAIRWFAFGLCVVGLTVLLWPLFAHGFPPYLYSTSLGCALVGYLQSVRHQVGQKSTVEPFGEMQPWQLLFWSLVFITRRLFLFEGHPHLLANDKRNDFGGPLCWTFRRGACALPVVVDRRSLACRDGITRLIAGAGDWSERVSNCPGRTTDRAGHCRIRDDLRRRSVRAPATKRASRRNAGVTAPKTETKYGVVLSIACRTV